MGDGRTWSKVVVRSKDRKSVFQRIGHLERQGWEKVKHWQTGEPIEPKPFYFLDGEIEWICVMRTDKPKGVKNKNKRFIKTFY
jgi:hypothetical protein